MPLTVEQAYAQIKALEQSGQLSLPQTIDTVEVGSINVTTGVFSYGLQTVTQTYVHPPLDTDPPPLPPTFPPGQVMFAVGGAGLGSPTGPGGHGGPGFPDPPLQILVGIVRTSAVNLRLKFKLTGVRRRPPVSGQLATATLSASAAPASERSGGIAAAAHATAVAGAALATGGVLATDAGVGIEGFPTIVSDSTQIVIDAGFAASRKLNSQYVSPAIEIFPINISAAGSKQFIHVMILRPPVLGLGAFTIPALPITVIYAPPQGKQAKNSAQFSDVTTVSRSLTSSVKTDQVTKRVQAYSSSELMGKISGAIEQAAAFVAMVAAAPAPGASAAAGSGGGGSNGGGSDALKDVKTEFNLMSTILNGLGNQMAQTDSTTLTSQSDQSLTVTCSNSSMFGSQAALGPGVGDRFIYMSDVRVVWMALNGEVGIHVLGFQAVKAVTAQGLLQDQQALASGGVAAVTGLDAATITNLLDLDPFCVRRRTVVGPALVAPPRFVPAVPPERAGEGTGSSGDQISVSYGITTEDKQVRTNVQTTVKELKPGWLDVVFGAENVSTTSTFTFTVSQTADTKVDDKITYTATFFSQGTDDPYDVLIFYDRLLGSMLFAPRGSTVLQGDVSTTTTTSSAAVS